MWDRVIAQPTATTLLRSAATRDEVAHAWLFVGPAGVGQREAARALAAALNCADAIDGSGCGECSTCRRIDNGSHPASREFEPEGAAHVVDSVREEWIPVATRTLIEGRRQVLRVVAADRMNEGAQNAFLKVLEEPPPSVVWVLDVEDESLVLDTVVSRCRRVDFLPWTPDAMAERARGMGVPEQRVPALVRASMGSPQRMADLADEDVATARHRHLGLVGLLADRGPVAVVPAVKEIDTWARGRTKAKAAANAEEFDRLEDAFGGEWPAGVRARLVKRFERLEREERRRALTLALDDLASYLRDLLVVAGGGGEQAVVNLDHLDDLRRDAQRVPVAVALDGLDAVAGCDDALERNGQPELQLERVLLRLAVQLQRRPVGAR